MNVLHINKDFSGTGAQRVSLAILTATTAKRRWYCADPLDPVNFAFLQELRDAGVTPLSMRGLSNSNVLWLPLAILRLAWHIRRQGVGLVHTHSLLAGVAGRIAALLTRTPCVHTFHGAPSRDHSRVAFLICVFIERLLARFTHTTVFNTEHQRRAVGVEPPRARVIHNFVAPPERSVPVRTGASGRNVLFLGRFEFQKNPEFFVQLASRLRSEGLSFRMVGGGSLEPKVRARNEAAGAPVEIHGFAEDPRPHFAWADCMVMCSRYESFPLVIGEALRSGCAVVSSRVNGLDELWQGAVEFFDEGDLVGAERALRSALENAQVGSSSRGAVLENFSLQRFHAAHEALYQEVFATKNSRAPARLGLE